MGGALARAGLVHAVGWTAELVFAHLHNFIAVALWAAWRPPASKVHLWVLAAFVLASLALSPTC